MFIVAEARFAVANGVPGIVPGWAAVGGFTGSREREREELLMEPRNWGIGVACRRAVCMSRSFCMPVKFVGVREVFNFLIYCLLKGSDLM